MPPPPPPAGTPILTVGKSGASASLTWTAVGGATGFDVATGDLGVLHATGSFQSSTQACLAGHAVDAAATDSSTTAAGIGRWFLVRAANCGGAGTYNDGTQIGSRDPGIQASPSHCP